MKIGCDPELFAFNKETKTYVSVKGMIKGDKQNPTIVPCGAVQVDGTAAEFNIDPAETRQQFLHNIRHVRSLLQRMITKNNKEIILVAAPSVVYSEEYFKNLSSGEKALGCEPDMNAYNGKFNEKPDGNRTTMRTGAGHIHIQFIPDGHTVEDVYDPAHVAACCSLAKSLDVVLYRSSGLWDTDTDRMKLYGRPGAFRPKPYGIEYRTLSNAWLNDEWTQMFVYDASVAVTEQWKKGVYLEQRNVRDIVTNFKGYCTDLQNLGIPHVLNYVPEGYFYHKVG